MREPAFRAEANDAAFLDELLPPDGGGSEVAARPAETGRNAAVDEGAA